MSRVAVFVDAGYLYAEGAKSVTGNDHADRHGVTLNISLVVPYLIEQAENITKQKLLRVYWYDAARSGNLTTEHQILASTDNVKLRLGVMNNYGKQKEVDGKILTDLIELSRNRAFTDAVLISGDTDLRLGVELAQQYGTRVHLLTIEGRPFSLTLRQESDTMTVVARESLQAFMTVIVVPYKASQIMVSGSPAKVPALPQTNQDGLLAFPSTTIPRLAAVAEVQPFTGSDLDSDRTMMQAEVAGYLTALSSATKESLIAALRTGSGVPAEHDGQLLARTRNAFGRNLTPPEKTKLRRALKDQLGIVETR